ncbi:MAG TPA: YbaK/EbsC family protein [Cellulomonas sp.]
MSSTDRSGSAAQAADGTPQPVEATRSEGAQRAAQALAASGVPFTITQHGPVRSLQEAAAARGVDPSGIVKSLVVRRGEGDYLFVLVPGDRGISWPKLRALLGVSRMSLPDAATAKEVTGYERGTITPFGSLHPWPVVADSRVPGRPASIGGGAHGVGATLDGDDLVRVLGATVADVTEPLGDGA